MAVMAVAVCGLRWAVNCTAWVPTKHEWLCALSLVQKEEMERIGKFVFSKDAKLALVGRLLMRAALVDLMSVANDDIVLGRSGRGKPILEGEFTDTVSFNISHQGDFVVLATEDGSRPVGVDVMQFTRPRGECVSKFFHTMRRQFTAKEWSHINEPHNEACQLNRFYRFWCLKESFIKAEGSGLAFGLQNVEFIVDPLLPWPPTFGEMITNSRVYIDRELSEQWAFQESLLNDDHCVAVAVRAPPSTTSASSNKAFTQLSVQQLLNKLCTRSSHDNSVIDHCDNFCALEREWELYLSKQTHQY